MDWFALALSPAQWAGLQQVAWLMLGIALLCFAVGEFTGNVSQVDKLWSLLPPAYAWIIAAHGGYEGRPVLMALLATLWGARLTYNFSRHGAYQWKFWGGFEDWRWVHVRKMPMLQSKAAWMAFHLGFIGLYQNALLLMLALPVLAVQGAPRPLGILDALLAAAFVGMVVLETVADQQQWEFQREKKRRLQAGEPLDGRYAAGFVHDGLWARSRHPNYFAEQSIWVVLFLFSVVATGTLNWSIAGCLLLILLFRGSSNLGEQLQAQKYPAYPDYHKRTPRFVPRLF